MKQFHSYLTLFWLVFLASIPPIVFFLHAPRLDFWFVIVLIAGFFGLFTIFIKTDWKIRVVAIGGFVLCFFGTSFAICFTSYISVVLCCYFYINCLKIENWKLIFQAMQTLLFLNVLLSILQIYGHDTLLNWSKGRDITCYGEVGYHMQTGSFAVILSAILLPFSLWNLLFAFAMAIFCKSTWTFFCAGVGTFCILYFRHKGFATIFALIALLIFCVWSIKTDKFVSNAAENGRIGTWEKTIHFAMKKPWTGWGPGSYKVVFPPLDHDTLGDKPYSTAHNWVLELFFETGTPFTLFIIWWLSYLFWRLWRAKETIVLAGLAMICMDGMAHFPDRMAQCIGIIICFLAYCEVRLRVIEKP